MALKSNPTKNAPVRNTTSFQGVQQVERATKEAAKHVSGKKSGSR